MLDYPTLIGVYCLFYYSTPSTGFLFSRSLAVGFSVCLSTGLFTITLMYFSPIFESF